MGGLAPARAPVAVFREMPEELPQCGCAPAGGAQGRQPFWAHLGPSPLSCGDGGLDVALSLGRAVVVSHQ